MTNTEINGPSLPHSDPERSEAWNGRYRWLGLGWGQRAKA